MFDFVEQEGSGGVHCDLRRGQAAARKERPQYFGKEHRQFDVQGRRTQARARMLRRTPRFFMRRRTSLDRAGRGVKTSGIDPKTGQVQLVATLDKFDV